MTAVGSDTIYLTDSGNHTVRRLQPSTATVSTFAGSAQHRGNLDGTGGAARFFAPGGIAADATSTYVTDGIVRKIDLATGAVTTFAGTPDMDVSADGIGPDAKFTGPSGLAFDGSGNLWVCDQFNHTLRKIDLATRRVTTVAGSPLLSGTADGVGQAARFNLPRGVAWDGGSNLYVSDTLNHSIRKLDLSSGAVSTVAGTPGQSGYSDGTGTSAQFNHPSELVFDHGALYVADSRNFVLRRIDVATGAVTTFAGSPSVNRVLDGVGAGAGFASPGGLSLDGAGNLFISDTSTVRRMALASGAVDLVVGVPTSKGVQLGPVPASLNQPSSIAALPSGDVLIVDFFEASVLRLHAP